MLTLGVRSLWNRRFVVALTVLSIALSVVLILGVERLRSAAKDGFARSASGIDLIVGPRGDPVQILMATVFGIGSTGPGLSWGSYEMIAAMPEVDWAVPISMGDNHRGYPVIGTSPAYFERFRHSGGDALRFAEGMAFASAGDAVIGAEVAARFGYRIGTVIVNAHGSGAVSFDIHDDAPFTIRGILEPTRTAVDRMVFVSLEGFAALHDEPDGDRLDPLLEAPLTGGGTPSDDAHQDGWTTRDLLIHEPRQINAIYVGLERRNAILSVQRSINDHAAEPLSAVLPNVALLQLWSITGTAEAALRLMAWAVALVGIIGMVVMLSAALEARRREFAILRSVGATPSRIFTLIVIEAGLITLAGLAAGVVLFALGVALVDPVLTARYGLHLGAAVPGVHETGVLAAIFLAGLCASVVPAVRVYRMTLADGLSFRV
jgi:putative ABC transport system permease protein